MRLSLPIATGSNQGNGSESKIGTDYVDGDALTDSLPFEKFGSSAGADPMSRSGVAYASGGGNGGLAL